MTIIKAEYTTSYAGKNLNLIVKTSEGYFSHFTIQDTTKEAFARCWDSIRFQSNWKKRNGTRIFK